MSITFSECSSCHTINKLDAETATKKTPVCGKCAVPLKLHGLVSEISSSGLEKVLRNSKTPVVVDFWASWCGPCRSYGPEYEKASLQNKNAVFLKINTETEQQLSGKLAIRGIPCTIIFKNGKEVSRQAGAMSAEQLGSFIAKLPNEVD